MEAGQVAVEHDHVVVVDERARQASLAVERDIDRHPRVTQAGRDRFGQLLVVLDHKYPHLWLLVVMTVATQCFSAVSPVPANELPPASESETGPKHPTA